MMINKISHFKINVIKKALSHIPCINAGGCGIAAYVLYHVAKQVAPNADIKIMYIYVSEYEYNSNKSVIENNDLSGVHAPSHCFITIDGERYDTSKRFSDWEDNMIEVKPEFLIKSITNGTWNPSFNRKHCQLIERFSLLDLSLFYNEDTRYTYV